MTPREVALTLIGGPTLVIEVGGVRLLTDPTFDPPGKYVLPHVTLEKRAGPAIALDALGKVDAVLLSHDQHADNLDNAGRVLLARVPAVFTTRTGCARLGGTAHGLAPWETVDCAGAGGHVRVTATPARHGPVGIEPMSGDVIGFVVGTDAPGDAIYVTGDTVWYDGVAEVARRFAPRLVVLFTGAAKTRGSVHLTMDSNDAIEAAHAFPDAQLVAIHNDSWGHFTESGEDLAKAFTLLGLGERLHVLRSGVRTVLTI